MNEGLNALLRVVGPLVAISFYYFDMFLPWNFTAGMLAITIVLSLGLFWDTPLIGKNSDQRFYKLNSYGFLVDIFQLFLQTFFTEFFCIIPKNRYFIVFFCKFWDRKALKIHRLV